MTASKPFVSSLQHQHFYLVHQTASKHIGTSSHEWTEVGSTRVTKSYLEILPKKILTSVWKSGGRKNLEDLCSLSFRLGIA